MKNKNIALEAWQHSDETQSEAIARAIAENAVAGPDVVEVRLHSLTETRPIRLVKDGRRLARYINHQWFGRLLDLTDLVRSQKVIVTRKTAMEAIERFNIRNPDKDIILGATK
jgi:hypothetical protein